MTRMGGGLVWLANIGGDEQIQEQMVSFGVGPWLGLTQHQQGLSWLISSHVLLTIIERMTSSEHKTWQHSSYLFSWSIQLYETCLISVYLCPAIPYGHISYNSFGANSLRKPLLV